MADQQPGGMPPLWPQYPMPFYYQSLSMVEYLYTVRPREFSSYFKEAPLEAARVTIPGGEACVVSWNFELYTAVFNTQNPALPTASTTTEMELCIVAYPRSERGNVPTLSFEELVRGQDQTKLLGSWRVHVAADNKVAVEAGTDNFGEPKFYSTFSVFNFPAPNGVDDFRWDVRLNAPPQQHGHHHAGQDDFIFRFSSDLTGLRPSYANPSPITYYGMAPLATHPKASAFIGSRWNLLGPMQLFMGDGDPKRCEITYGGSQARNMAADMQELIGGMAPTAIRLYQSPPVAIEGRAFYAY